MNLSKLKNNLLVNLKQIPGPHTKRKILVFECDDWGSIRMPSERTYKALLNKGFSLNNRYDSYDTLADADDLQALFQVLESEKDQNGHPAVMTPLVNVTNPDFEKIKASGFRELFFETFDKSLIRYGRNSNTIEVWKQGLKKGIFIPEYHGHSHITAQLWLKKLQSVDPDVLEAFNHGFVHPHIRNIPSFANGFRPELFFDHPNQIPFLEKSLKEGISIFKNIFEYSPRVFAPTNGIFHPIFEKPLNESGIKYLYVSWFTKIPDGDGGLKKKFYPIGTKGKEGLIYYSRNCAFEPTDKNYDLGLTLRQIEAAFKWGKPAIISTHRVNFVGGISKENRQKGLNELKKLLSLVKKQWPEVEFMGSADMLKVLFRNN